jgi:hypothetical protein
MKTNQGSIPQAFVSVKTAFLKQENWLVRVSTCLLLAILLYLGLFTSFALAGSSILSIGIGNLAAGLISRQIWRDELIEKGSPVTIAIGVFGVIGIATGIPFSNNLFNEIGTSLLVIYEGVVITSFLWALLAEYFFPQLPRTKIDWMHLSMHLLLGLIVGVHLYIKWQRHWGVDTFGGAMLAVVGYHLFNLSLRLANLRMQSRRDANTKMNIIGGCALIVIAAVLAFFYGWNLLIPVFTAMIGTALMLVGIVYIMGKNYQFMPKPLAPLVQIIVYDGILSGQLAIMFLLGMAIVWQDAVVTGMIAAVIAIRVIWETGKIRSGAIKI